MPFGAITASGREECGRQIDRLRPRSGTLIGPPIVAALRTFDDKKPDGLKLVLLMTDGDDNDRERFSRLREQIAELSDKLGVQVHAISVGDEVSDGGKEDLTDLATKGKGRYEHSPGAERLAEMFRSRIAETVNECTLVYDSPYPTADGFDRPVTVSIRTPAGPLTATASYKIGPLLSARSKPAAWRSPRKQRATGRRQPLPEPWTDCAARSSQFCSSVCSPRLPSRVFARKVKPQNRRRSLWRRAGRKRFGRRRPRREWERPPRCRRRR